MPDYTSVHDGNRRRGDSTRPTRSPVWFPSIRVELTCRILTAVVHPDSYSNWTSEETHTTDLDDSHPGSESSSSSIDLIPSLMPPLTHRCAERLSLQHVLQRLNNAAGVVLASRLLKVPSVLPAAGPNSPRKRSFVNGEGHFRGNRAPPSFACEFLPTLG